MSAGLIWSNVEGNLDHTKYLTVMCLAVNNQINITTMESLNKMAKELGKQLILCSSPKTGLPQARGGCYGIAKSYYGVDKIRGMWLTSDYVIKDSDMVVKWIKEADEKNESFSMSDYLIQYYGDLDLNYVFHSDSTATEEEYFFKENYK